MEQLEKEKEGEKADEKPVQQEETAGNRKNNLCWYFNYLYTTDILKFSVISEDTGI